MTNRFSAAFPRSGGDRRGALVAGEPCLCEAADTADLDGEFCRCSGCAARHGVGKDFVAKVWRDRRLRPWQVDTFKLSTDPEFEAKLVDVVGLYMDPPERAVVLSFDEKTQVQALDRTQPSLPLKPGRGRAMTHDYRRHGTVDLFAALNVETGEVLTQTRKRHTGDGLLQVDRSPHPVPPRRARRVRQLVRSQVAAGA